MRTSDRWVSWKTNAFRQLEKLRSREAPGIESPLFHQHHLLGWGRKGDHLKQHASSDRLVQGTFLVVNLATRDVNAATNLFIYK